MKRRSMQPGQQHAGHYEWFSGFLEARGVTIIVRLFVASTALLMAIALLILLVGAGGPQEQPQQAMMWLAVGGGAAGAVLYLVRWPTRTQSIAFVAVTTVSISLSCLAYPDPLAALLGCIAFTTIAAYTAFFHRTRLVVAVFSATVAVALAQAVELAAHGRIALAVVDFFLVVQANIAMPVAIHCLIRTLKGDLAYADLDPLTGLLNRRAFRRQTGSLIARRHDSGSYLLVALLDLDDFKSLNDTHGHAVGDQALVAVADALRATATPTAVIARIGGEEFLIADVASTHQAVERYHDVCTAISGLPIPVTSSVGTSVAALDEWAKHGRDAVVDHLIAAADMAMYRAKRNGGNQCHHHGVSLEPGATA